MKHFKLFGVALLAMFALSATMSSAASAGLPELLPVKEGGTKFTGKSDQKEGEGIVVETSKAEKFECKTASLEGVQATDTLGTFHISLKGCEEPSLKVECKSKGDAAKETLSLGTFHYVYDTLTPELGVAILFLIGTPATAFECLTVKVEVKGTLLCLVLEPLVSMVTHLFHCIKGKNAGEQSEKTWWNDAGTAQTAHLLISKAGGEFIELNELALATVTFPEAVAFMNE